MNRCRNQNHESNGGFALHPSFILAGLAVHAPQQAGPRGYLSRATSFIPARVSSTPPGTRQINFRLLSVAIWSAGTEYARPRSMTMREINSAGLRSWSLSIVKTCQAQKKARHVHGRLSMVPMDQPNTDP